MKRSWIFFSSLLLLIACKEIEARRPKQHSTTHFYKELLEKTKKLNTRERRFLENLIKNDTIHNYQTSSTGFWFTYIKKDSTKTNTPKPGDIVTITYNIADVYGKELYAKKQTEYKVDKEDFIPALQEGIKLMKSNETITFVVPSYRAFGVTGDGNKIGINQPIKSTITLINIKKQNNENK